MSNFINDNHYDFTFISSAVEGIMAFDANGVGVSMKWKSGMTVINGIARLNRIFDLDDPLYNGMSYQEKVEETHRWERIVEEALQIYGWSCPLADQLPRFNPTIDTLLEAAKELKPQEIISDEEAFKKRLKLSDKRMEAIKKRAEERYNASQQWQIAAVRNADVEHSIRHLLEQAERNVQEPQWINPFTAFSYVGKLAEKAVQYYEEREVQAWSTRRPRRQAKLLHQVDGLREIYEHLEDEYEALEEHLATFVAEEDNVDHLSRETEDRMDLDAAQRHDDFFAESFRKLQQSLSKEESYFEGSDYDTQDEPEDEDEDQAA